MIPARSRSLGTRLTARIAAVVAEPGMTMGETERRTTLVVASATIALLSIVWVATYLGLGRPSAAAIPFAYQVLTVAGLLALRRGLPFTLFRASQIASMSLLPFLLQWSVGGYAASSAVSLWALVTALGAVFFLGAAAAMPWLLLFLLLTGASAFADPWLSAGATLLPASVRTAFFGLNILGVSVTAFVIVQYFVRQREQALAALDLEHSRSESLLRNVLPGPIAERLKAGSGTIADAHDAVSVLFADVVDFTPYAERVSPEDVVRVLDRIFSAFDEIADRHGLEKIKTIGDAYLLVGGLPEPRSDHAVAVARAAFELIEAAERLAVETGTGLGIRVGIDCGPVVAGVIGRRKFSYDLWGDTVNTAARMEASGSVGRIHVTGRVEALLRDRFAFEPRGTITLKGKSGIEAFYLVRERTP